MVLYVISCSITVSSECEAGNMWALNTCCLISQSGQLPGPYAAQGPGSGCVWSALVQTMGPDHITKPPPLHNRHRE